MTTRSAAPNFQGRRVLALESRRAAEVGTLIATYGGEAVVAPALREVPLESNPDAIEFAKALLRGDIDIVIFMTGVGTRTLVGAIETTFPREAFVRALANSKVVARGPKPLAVLRELDVPIWISVPEPNTWHEVLAAIEARASEVPVAPKRRSGESGPLQGAAVAIQEYGVTNAELVEALTARGARVQRVPVYRWALPVDVAPLRNAVTAIANGLIDVAMFTTGVQVVHLWQIVVEMQMEAQVRAGLARAVIGSIGPTTSDRLREYGLAVDLEASHPKFGVLIRELAERSHRSSKSEV